MPKPPPPTSLTGNSSVRWHACTSSCSARRATRGKLGGIFLNPPVLLLNHVGRKSGQAPVPYLDDTPRLVIVASKGGVDAHPAWFHNLMAMATTEVELPSGERSRVRPRLAEGDERAALWRRPEVMYKPYAAYATYTERQIPVVVLEPAPA
ncbi:nitroreductase/quinone reductase family protein [Nonomuraea sp. NPDC049714]|uniref:nitroreductase/quinone reductase family protein n=1 Tax=Nonomuraea sp. NPDC049714 TaxID=3364357 RepID=UPI0037B2BC83